MIEEEEYRKIDERTNKYLEDLEKDQKKFEEEMKRKREERKKKEQLRGCCGLRTRCPQSGWKKK